MEKGNILNSALASLRQKKTDRRERRIEFLTPSSAMKEEMIERSNNGFGRPGYSLSRMLRYIYLHMDDGCGIDLDCVDELIKTIKDNRSQLDRIDIFFEEILRETNRIGNNINQVTKRVNLESLIAKEEGTPEYKLGKKLLDMIKYIQYYQDELLEKIRSFTASMSPNREALKNVIGGEDELLTRCLVFPNAGEKEQQYKVLIRKIKDYIGGNKEQYHNMTIGQLLAELNEKIESKTKQ